MNSAVPASPVSGSQRLPPQAARSALHGPPPVRATRRSTRRRPRPSWPPSVDLERCEDVEKLASFGGRKIRNSMNFKLFNVISTKSLSLKYVFWHCDMSFSLVLDTFLSHRIVMLCLSSGAGAPGSFLRAAESPHIADVIKGEWQTGMIQKHHLLIFKVVIQIQRFPVNSSSWTHSVQMFFLLNRWKSLPQEPANVCHPKRPGIVVLFAHGR